MSCCPCEISNKNDEEENKEIINDNKFNNKTENETENLSNERKVVCKQNNITVATLSEADKQYFNNFFEKYDALNSGGRPDFVVLIKCGLHTYIFFLTKAATYDLIKQIDKKAKKIFDSKLFNITAIFPNSKSNESKYNYQYLIQSGVQKELINQAEYSQTTIKDEKQPMRVVVFKHCDNIFYFRVTQEYGKKVLQNFDFLPENFDFLTLKTVLANSLPRPDFEQYTTQGMDNKQSNIYSGNNLEDILDK